MELTDDLVSVNTPQRVINLCLPMQFEMGRFTEQGKITNSQYQRLFFEPVDSGNNPTCLFYYLVITLE